DCPIAPRRTGWTGLYAVPADQGAGQTPDLPALLQTHGIPYPLIRSSDLVGGLDRLSDAERWLLWVELPNLAPPWHVAPRFVRRYFTEEEEADEEPLTPLTKPPIGPIDVDDFTLTDRLQSTYAAAVTQLDDEMGAIVEELERRALLDEVLVVFLSDLGLPLGEHGIVGHSHPWPHDELIHLPLIVRLPRAAEAGRRIAALTQPVDLMPTLLEWFGLPALPGHGQNLLPLMHGEIEQVRPYAVSLVAIGEAEEWALRTPEWGLVLPVQVPPEDAARGPQLYVKPDDRWEVNNVVQHHLELAEGLERTLRGFVEAVRLGTALPPLPELESRL
ncbi:MAG TPA: sulfatase-like hydrolase/transferase, partial [Gemmataceae bacterium]|nr:sulfatase-like hydrolase/transferase [Gemmataceae bacterium]